MKKPLLAAALLTGLFLLSVWNTRHIEALTAVLGKEISAARQHCLQGEYAAAEGALDRAYTRWLEADGYTHVFIRHSEIDAAAEIFCDLRGDILAKDADSAAADAEKLLYRLESICAMERVSFKSVF